MKSQDAFFQRKKSLLFAGILTAIIICIFLFYFLTSKSSLLNTFEKKEIITPITQPISPEFIDEYKKKVREKVLSYDLGATAQEVRDYLVATTVPSHEFKDIHLDLIIIFDKLDLAERNNNMEEKNNLIKKLGVIKNKNGWLQ